MGGSTTNADNGHSESARIEAERPYRRNPEDPADNVTGGFNQWSRLGRRTGTGDDTRIRDEAYRLWEEAGRPDGDADRFWYAAQAQMTTKSEA